MKERPILFQGDMVRAILEGRKTQTRRVAKGMPPMPAPECHPNHTPKHEAPYFDAYCGQPKTEKNPRGMGDNWNWWQVDDRACLPQVKCPYGQPGDQLWVREAWTPTASGNGTIFRADMTILPNQRDPEVRAFFAQHERLPERAFKWRPSIHMPRWASRIQLEITYVRVERLQDISEEDAQAEGVESPDVEREERDFNICPRCGGTRLHDSLGPSLGVVFDVDCTQCDTNKKRYRHLWESINGPGSWDANPFVWVVTFKRINHA